MAAKKPTAEKAAPEEPKVDIDSEDLTDEPAAIHGHEEVNRLADFIVQAFPEEPWDPEDPETGWTGKPAVDVAIRLLTERMPATPESRGSAIVDIGVRWVMQARVVSEHSPTCRRATYDRPYNFPQLGFVEGERVLMYRCNDAECTGSAIADMDPIDAVVFEVLEPESDEVQDAEEGAST
jgi:hypothetical protein